MTIKSKQLSKIVSHYIARGNNRAMLERLIETFNTGKPVNGVVVEDLGKLGKSYSITNFGAYIVDDSESVLFLKNI